MVSFDSFRLSLCADPPPDITSSYPCVVAAAPGCVLGNCSAANGAPVEIRLEAKIMSRRRLADIVALEKKIALVGGVDNVVGEGEAAGLSRIGHLTQDGIEISSRLLSFSSLFCLSVSLASSLFLSLFSSLPLSQSLFPPSLSLLSHLSSPLYSRPPSLFLLSGCLAHAPIQSD